MFHIGDKVVHPMHGAGIVESIVQKKVNGVTRDYYILKLPVRAMVVMVPVEHCEEIGVRPIVDRALADFDQMRTREGQRLEADILSGDYEARVAQANEILDGIYPEKDGKGYRLADGKRIHFDILANPGELELVSYLQSQFARIGIEVEYKAEGSTAEDTYLFDGDFDMTFQATILNIANIDIMYRSHFVQVDDRSSNYGRLMDEELTAMIEQMRTSLNLNTKYELVKQIQMRLAESYYKVPVYASNVISVVRKDRFTGYVAGPGETAFNLDTLEVLQKVV